MKRKIGTTGVHIIHCLVQITHRLSRKNPEKFAGVSPRDFLLNIFLPV